VILRRLFDVTVKLHCPCICSVVETFLWQISVSYMRARPRSHHLELQWTF